MVRWLLERPSSLEMGKLWKHWFGSERALEVWLFPWKVIKLITCTWWHGISQEVTALWGYHPLACNCPSQGGLRHGRIQTNGIRLWFWLSPSKPPPSLSLLRNDGVFVRATGANSEQEKAHRVNSSCYIVGMVLVQVKKNAAVAACFFGRKPSCALRNKQLGMVLGEWIF